MKKKYQSLSISNFTFTFMGRGLYSVEFFSTLTNKSWVRFLSDMKIIDLTKNAEYPKQKDLKRLKVLCKQGAKR